MSSQAVVLLGGISAVLALDTLGSLASRRRGFSYGRLAPVSYVIWALTGAAAARVNAAAVGSPFVAGAMAGGLVGLVDATLGWWISWRLGPGRLPPERVTARLMTQIVFLVGIRATAFGAAGGLIASLLAPA
jgi:hypothetical protein